MGWTPHLFGLTPQLALCGNGKSVARPLGLTPLWRGYTLERPPLCGVPCVSKCKGGRQERFLRRDQNGIVSSSLPEGKTHKGEPPED